MKKIFKIALSLFAVTCLFNSQLWAEEKDPVALGGYVGIVSNYVWRGVPASGPAVQGSMELTMEAVPGLAAGVWLSSAAVDKNAGAGNETDYYVSYGGEAGDLSYSLGWNDYRYNFSRFGDGIASESEYFLGLGYGIFSFTYFMIPDQKSTEGTNKGAGGSYNWIEAGISSEISIYTLGAKYTGGNYSSRGDATLEAESVSALILNVDKKITDQINVSFNFQKVTGNNKAESLEDQFWFGANIAY